MSHLLINSTETHKSKASLTHIDLVFNQEMEVAFTLFYIEGKHLKTFNIVDMGTKYGDRIFVPS